MAKKAKKAKKPDKHLPGAAHECLHTELEGETEGGACLTGHSSSYKEQSSCTYRWQALQKAAAERHELYKGQPGMIKADRVNKVVETSRYKTKSGHYYPRSIR